MKTYRGVHTPTCVVPNQRCLVMRIRQHELLAAVNTLALQHEKGKLT